MGTLSQRFAISVMFHDRVGIVAEVSAAVEKLGGNLLDVSQTVLGGYFSMILLGDFPQDITQQEILKALEGIALLKGACFGVLPFVESQETPAANDDTYILTASGHDQPGLVAKLSAYLKERKINIVDLSSRNHNGDYTMIWQITLPPDLDVQKLQKSIKLAFKPDLDIGLRHEALFKVTNEI